VRSLLTKLFFGVADRGQQLPNRLDKSSKLPLGRSLTAGFEGSQERVLNPKARERLGPE